MGRLSSAPGRLTVLFPTVEFAVFFPVVLALSWALMPRPRMWKPFIIAASYAFYAAASWRFVVLLAGATVANQVAAQAIHRAGDGPRRARLLAAIIALDLGLLGIFKYYAFFAEDFERSFDRVGLGFPLPLLTIALPVGDQFLHVPGHLLRRRREAQVG